MNHIRRSKSRYPLSVSDPNAISLPENLPIPTSSRSANSEHKHSVEIPVWIQIKHRMGVNAMVVNGFYRFRGKSSTGRVCYLKSHTNDCWIYYQSSTGTWFIGDPSKGNYASIQEDLSVPINPEKPIMVWNGSKMEEDTFIRLVSYDPKKDENVEEITEGINQKIQELSSATDYVSAERVFWYLKEHLQTTRPTLSAHIEALVQPNGPLEQFFDILNSHRKSKPIKKVTYKFLAHLIVILKDVKNSEEHKKVLVIWCQKIFDLVLPHVCSDFAMLNNVENPNWVEQPHLSNGAMALGNAMEFLDRVDDDNLENLDMVFKGCLRAMAHCASHTDKVLFMSPIMYAAMFPKCNWRLRKVSNLISTIHDLLDVAKEKDLQLQLLRLLICLCGDDPQGQAFMNKKEKSQDKIEGEASMTEPKDICNKMVNCLLRAKEGKPLVNDGHVIYWVLWHALYIIKILASNDLHKQFLVELDVPDICIEILNWSGEKKDIVLSNPYLSNVFKNQEQAYKILQHLSFVENVREKLRANTAFISKVRSASTLYPETSSQISWNVDPSGSDRRNSSAVLNETSDEYVLFSYSDEDEWAVQKISHQLRQDLGYNVVLNSTERSVDSRAMTESVDNATIVICVMSNGYFSSARCRNEATYVWDKGAPCVWVSVAAPSWEPVGWLSIMGSRFLRYTPKNVDSFSIRLNHEINEQVKKDSVPKRKLPIEMSHHSETEKDLVDKDLDVPRSSKGPSSKASSRKGPSNKGPSRNIETLNLENGREMSQTGSLSPATTDWNSAPVTTEYTSIWSTSNDMINWLEAARLERYREVFCEQEMDNAESFRYMGFMANDHPGDFVRLCRDYFNMTVGAATRFGFRAATQLGFRMSTNS